jgi:hypothetical protein
MMTEVLSEIRELAIVAALLLVVTGASVGIAIMIAMSVG